MVDSWCRRPECTLGYTGRPRPVLIWLRDSVSNSLLPVGAGMSHRNAQPCSPTHKGKGA
jgi:hypothetical protein